VQIVVNTRLLIRDRLDGIGWFSYQTLRRICINHPEVHFVFLFDRPFDPSFIFSDNVTPVILGPPARHPLLYYIWFEISVRRLLNKMKPDLFLSPDGFLSLGAKCPQLPVIHDINFYHHPRDSKWLTTRYYNYFFPKFAAKARRIATVSEYSRRDIASAYNIDAGKIDVVYNGVNSFFKPVSEDVKIETRKKFAGDCEYFVAVGSLHPRKNIVNLIQAFSLFKKENGSSMKLLLAGPGYWGLKEIHKSVEESGYSNDIIFTGRLADEDLAVILGSAMALTFVPHFEGFGIPLVEAMAAQVPIICSNVTSLPEVAADAALLVNPSKPNEIKDAMVRICNEPGLRASLIEKGNERVRHFSWDKTSALLWESIQRALGQ
jgi:glycosyltransferase involved in cell wall biosynthesis